MEFTLLAAALTGVTALWLALRLGDHVSEFDRLLGAAAVGLFTGRLVAMIASGISPLTNPLDVLIVRGGVSTVCATAGALAYLVWSARNDRRVVDAVAPAAVAGLAGWHAGCLWRGTCLGAATDLPWGWELAGSDVSRHPVELYTAILLAAAAWSLTRIHRPTGVVAGLALAVAAGARLITEPLRPSLTGGPVGWYAAAVVIGAVGAVAFARRAATRT
jgi:prolipoprotein diacylglyceryltransferase